MCFGGKSKTPEVTAAPAASPAPTITPSTSSPQDEQERRTRLKRLRSGLISTIKTSPKGVTGTQADLTSPTLLGKQTLGS